MHLISLILCGLKLELWRPLNWNCCYFLLNSFSNIFTLLFLEELQSKKHCGVFSAVIGGVSSPYCCFRKYNPTESSSIYVWGCVISKGMLKLICWIVFFCSLNDVGKGSSTSALTNESNFVRAFSLPISRLKIDLKLPRLFTKLMVF